MQSLWQDVRYGLRGVRANPGFSALAVVTLALGIGAGTTMFSVIKNVLLSPFPYKGANQIVAFAIHDLDRARPGGRSFFPPAEYLEFRERNRVFAEDIGGGNEDMLWTSDQGTEQLDGAYVTPNTFDFLGVPPLLGRVTTAEDVKPGAPPVFVMSHKLWTRRFHQDPSILGRSFILDGKPITLVGIMPKRFTKRGAELCPLYDRQGTRVKRAGTAFGRTYRSASAYFAPCLTRQKRTVSAICTSVTSKLLCSTLTMHPAIALASTASGIEFEAG